jgi:hypothetical protein
MSDPLTSPAGRPGARFLRPGAPWALALAAALALPARAPAGDPPAQSQPSAPAGPGGDAPSAPPDGVRRVVYLPETLKQQIREEIKREVLAEAKREGWAAPSVVPGWLARFRPSGDLRARWDRALFPAGNAAGGEFPDWNAINAGRPFDVNFVDVANERYLNVNATRTRPRLRARLGTEMLLGTGLSLSVRLASGESASPVSTNQTLGGGGGSFSRYPFWLDRASLRWAPLDSADDLAVDLGRFENPFFATEMAWSDGVGLDGLALRLARGSGFRPFLAAGAFPVYTTGFAFPAERPEKLASRNRWLFAGQLGLELGREARVGLKLGGAFYLYGGLEGKRSEPCDTHLKDVTCSTDDLRPGFAQKGNTYMALRVPSAAALAAEASGPAARYQYFGLATPFRVAQATARLHARIAAPLLATLEAEAARNLGWKRSKVAPLALNNLGRCDGGGTCPYAGGDLAGLARLTLGSPGRDRAGDWSASVSYRRVESDAVLDAFADPDFGLGGTNLKGYAVAASVALASGVVAGARWLSADAVAGPTYRVDVLQLDLQARF